MTRGTLRRIVMGVGAVLLLGAFGCRGTRDSAPDTRPREQEPTVALDGGTGPVAPQGGPAEIDSSRSDGTEGQEFERVSGSGFDGVIVPVERFRSVDGWTPTAGRVRAMEAELAAFVGAESWSDRVIQDLAHYKRQYWGRYRGSRKEIVTIFYHESTPIVVDGRWLRSVVAVAGGGDLYFQTRYDVEKGRFTRLVINAPA